MPLIEWIFYQLYSVEVKQLLVKGARFLNNLNVTCLIEPLSTRPNYYLRSYDTALALVKELNEPNLKIMFDTYHLQRLHGNILHYLEVSEKDAFYKLANKLLLIYF